MLNIINTKYITHNIFLIFVLLVFVMPAILPLFASFDIGWHIMAGHQILELKEIPKYDLWSWSANQEWYNIAWLWDIIISLTEKHCGLYGVFLLNCTIIILSLCYMYCVLCLYYKIPSDAALIATLISAIFVKYCSLMRPQLVSYIIVIFTMAHLHSNKDAIIDRTKLWCIVPLIVLYANVHGSFLIVLFTIFVYFVSAIKRKKIQVAQELFALGIIAFFATLINPLGYKVYLAILRTTDSSFIRYLAEWLPIAMNHSTPWYIHVSLFLIASIVRTKKAIPTEVHFFAVFWMIMAFSQARSIAFFAIFAAPYFGMKLSVVMQKNTIGKFITSLNYNAKIMLCTMCITTSVLIINATRNESRFIGNEKMIDRRGMEFLMTKYPNKKFFNDYSVGSHLIYFAKGKISHFLDGRAGTVFSDKISGKYEQYLKFGKLKHIITKDSNVFGAIIKKGRYKKFINIRKFFKDWQVVYKGPKFVVFTNPEYKPQAS